MFEDFHFLDLGERAKLILREGQHIATTNFYGAAVKLYHLKTRYVEMYHHPVTKQVMRVSFATSEDLDKHVKSVAIGCQQLAVSNANVVARLRAVQVAVSNAGLVSVDEQLKANS